MFRFNPAHKIEPLEVNGTYVTVERRPEIAKASTCIAEHLILNLLRFEKVEHGTLVCPEYLHQDEIETYTDALTESSIVLGASDYSTWSDYTCHPSVLFLKDVEPDVAKDIVTSWLKSNIMFLKNTKPLLQIYLEGVFKSYARARHV